MLELSTPGCSRTHNKTLLQRTIGPAPSNTGPDCIKRQTYVVHMYIYLHVA